MGKTMTDEEAKVFLSNCMRMEWSDNPRPYNKALRASLLALGYDSSWIEGRFRDIEEEFEEKFVKM